MKKRNLHSCLKALCLLVVFLLWTLLICTVDVQSIGPHGSCVGFAGINRFIHSVTGVHLHLYTITDWMSLVPVMIGTGFAVLGLIQWITRRSLLKVDHDILVLGCFYITVAAVYALFEAVVINYRPVLIQGCLEVSYPSSTTLLVLCVMPTAVMQFRSRIQSIVLRQYITIIAKLYTVFMVIARLVSGVHWFTDIIGGILLSAGFVMLYHAVVESLSNMSSTHHKNA